MNNINIPELFNFGEPCDSLWEDNDGNEINQPMKYDFMYNGFFALSSADKNDINELESNEANEYISHMKIYTNIVCQDESEFIFKTLINFLTKTIKLDTIHLIQKEDSDGWYDINIITNIISSLRNPNIIPKL